MVKCPMPDCKKKLKNKDLNSHIDKDHDLSSNNSKASSLAWGNLMSGNSNANASTSNSTGGSKSRVNSLNSANGNGSSSSSSSSSK